MAARTYSFDSKNCTKTKRINKIIPPTSGKPVLGVGHLVEISQFNAGSFGVGRAK